MDVTVCIGITYMNKNVYVVRKPMENVVTKFLVVEHQSKGSECFHFPYCLTPT